MDAMLMKSKISLYLMEKRCNSQSVAGELLGAWTQVGVSLGLWGMIRLLGHLQQVDTWKVPPHTTAWSLDTCWAAAGRWEV